MVVDYNGSFNDPGNTAKIGGLTITPNRQDGWGNVLSGLGKKGTDKTLENTYDYAPILDDKELSQVFIGEGLAKRIVNLPAKDAVREWISTPQDPSNKILDELKRLNTKTIFTQALSWARLYRGALIVMIEKGVVDLEKPLSANVKELESLRVYGANKINLTTADIEDSPDSKYFDEVEVFPITLRNGAVRRVHASRCLIFKGEQSPDDSEIDFKYRYWGLPFIMSVWSRLKNYGPVEQSIANLMLEFNIGKFTISNLAQLLAQNNEDGISQIYTRMEIINASKSILNAVLLGDGESYERDSANLSGVSEIIEQAQIAISAVSEIPVTKLWGRSPAGENATGESDIIQYYDDVSSLQETKVEPPLKKLIDIIAGYKKVSNASFEFNPLWQPTEKQLAEVNKMNAESDQIYITQGVVTPDEIRIKRFPNLDGGAPPKDVE